jgi:hypothetical protein
LYLDVSAEVSGIMQVSHQDGCGAAAKPHVLTSAVRNLWQKIRRVD